MSTVLVTGGGGRLGRTLVPRLSSCGYDVRTASRASGVDLVSGQGLTDAVSAADVVVHLATTNGKRDVDMMQNLVAALAARSGTGGTAPHLLYLSIVGCDRVPMPYYRAKTTAEQLALASGVPTTVLRATQFHSLVAQIFSAQRLLPMLLVPSIPMQPVDTADVAARIVALLERGPQGRAADLGGPEVAPLSAFADQWQAATGHRGRQLPVSLPGRTFDAYRRGHHLASSGALRGETTFTDYLMQQEAGQPHPA